MDFRLAKRLAYWGAWSLAAFYNFCRDVFSGSIGYLAVFNLVHFFLWGCLGLVAIPLIRRYPIRWHWQPWLLHLLLGTAFTLIDIVLGHWITFRLLGVGRHMSLSKIAMVAFENCFHLGLLTYAFMVGIVQGLDAHELSGQRAVKAAQLEARLVQAQLQSLRMQLQPHFLFNTLHAISSLMHYDVATADRMLNRLSELLRISLQEYDGKAVSLRQEMSFIEAYLEIEKLRFEQRLRIAWAIPEDLQGNIIPPFILQPLVENAIKHSISPRAKGGEIVIRAYTEGSELMLEVEDDAPAQLPKQVGFGIGLRNTRSRLETLYGVGQRFELIRAGMGTIARLRLPLAEPIAVPA